MSGAATKVPRSVVANRHVDRSCAPTTYVITLGHTWEQGDRLTQLDDTQGAAAITRAYDDLDRLTAETTA